MRLVISLPILLAACAQNPSHEEVTDARTRAKHDKVDYARYARETVGSFSATRLDDWDSTDPGSVVVWTRANEAW